MPAQDVLGRRVAAAAIDAAIVLLLLIVVAKTLGDEGATRRSIWAETSGSPRAVFFLLAFAYFFGTELAWAQTVGKRVMKLRVVMDDGRKLSAGPALVRNLVRVIDWLPILYVVGAVAVFATGPRRRRLGDLAARTKVVADDAAPPPPPRDRPEDEDILAQVMR
jgi:uncharacterized RDD family membrane protein YckC